MVPLWVLFVHESPAIHPHISQAELERISRSRTHSICQDVEQRAVPWFKILTSRVTITVAIAHVSNEWLSALANTDIPSYFMNAIGFDNVTNGFVTSLGFVVQIPMSILSGVVADLLINGKLLSVTNTRKLIIAIAYVGAALFLMLADFLGCDQVYGLIVSVILFTTFYEFDRAG